MTKQDIVFKQQQDNKQVKLLSYKDMDAILSEKVGERYDRYRADWRAGMQFERVPEFPLSIEIENLNHCNFSCHMCLFSLPKSHPDAPHKKENKRFLDFEVYKKAIDEASAHQMPALTHGVLCETLLHPRMMDMIAYAQDRGVVDQRLGSNGALLTKEVSERLVDLGLARLEISLDGFNEETFNMVRFGKGADYHQIVANIRDFLEIRERKNSRFPLLRLSFLKLNVNADQVEAFLDYWRDYADYFSIQEPVNYKLDLKKTSLVFDTPHEKPNFRCDKQHNRIFMRHDGTLLPCFHVHGWQEFALGNVKDSTIKEAWDSPKMQYLRALHKKGEYHKNKICHNCVMCTGQEA
ncbi:radical SAM/SPASM domain-containing protein [Magnetospira sp. QH-2]|uniref:radical SAM/SPASM domain-containing protein n=1 Tax=Magnetospira sp. (strain QH-2) TaxID=1288970 RepID=UPI0003E8115D|nr:radical SAM protein [Magnetospira sp. QH-2]CCQ73075.1 conserved protein of unknown function [Magnetospira sp. QH-2]